MSKALLCRELNGLKVIAVSAKKKGPNEKNLS